MTIAPDKFADIPGTIEAIEIEMIRGSSSRRRVGLHHEQPREMSAHDPAALKARAGAVEISWAKSESGEDPFCFMVSSSHPPRAHQKNVSAL